VMLPIGLKLKYLDLDKEHFYGFHSTGVKLGLPP
jgi:hypothetical protein